MNFETIFSLLNLKESLFGVKFFSIINKKICVMIGRKGETKIKKNYVIIFLILLKKRLRLVYRYSDYKYFQRA